MPYLERAWQDAQRGVPAEGPYIEVEVPTAVDPTLTDDGTTVLTMFTQFGPHAAEDWPDGAREAYARALLRAARPARARTCPTRSCTTRCWRRPTSSGSSASRAARSSRASRASTRWPSCARRRSWRATRRRSHGLYLCGAGTHPGGGVIAASGHNAAQRALRDLRAERDPRAPAPSRRGRARLNGHSVHIGRPGGRDRGAALTWPAESDSRPPALNDPSKPARDASSGCRAGRCCRRGGALAARRAAPARRWPAARTPRRRWPPAAPAGGGKGILGDPDRGRPGRQRRHPARAQDYPVVLPRLGDAVESSAKPERGGELQIYNYADYLNPAVIKAFGKQEGVSVRVTTFDTLDEAFSKLSTGGLRVRRHLLDARPALAPRRRAAHPAAELRADPQPAEERLARAAQPVLRRRPALQRPVRRPTRPGSRGATTCSTSTRARSTSRGTPSGRRRPRSTAARWRSSTTRARRRAWRSCAAG